MFPRYPHRTEEFWENARETDTGLTPPPQKDPPFTMWGVGGVLSAGHFATAAPLEAGD